ncbi:hypothetical protein Tco_0460319, partial [Tanacetum coccineum]
WRGESWGEGTWCSGPGCVWDGCVGEGEGVGEGEDVILEGEGEGSVSSNIVGNRATSWPKNPLVGLFILLNTFMVREGTR